MSPKFYIRFNKIKNSFRASSLMFIMQPYIGNIVWGSSVESNEYKRFVGTLKIGTYCKVLEEHWDSIINTVISYLLTIHFF
jgi:hypothetical protein